MPVLRPQSTSMRVVFPAPELPTRAVRTPGWNAPLHSQSRQSIVTPSTRAALGPTFSGSVLFRAYRICSRCGAYAADIHNLMRLCLLLVRVLQGCRNTLQDISNKGGPDSRIEASGSRGCNMYVSCRIVSILLAEIFAAAPFLNICI